MMPQLPTRLGLLRNRVTSNGRYRTFWAIGGSRNMSQLKAKRDTNYSSLLQNEQDRNSNVHSSTWTEDEQKRIRRGQLPQSFTNFGEEYWHQQRKEWLSPPDGEPPKRRRRKAVPVDVGKFESLLRHPETNQTFPHPVPLRQMIDIMTELWEDEGIFD